MKKTILLSLLLLSGCASFYEPEYKIIRNHSKITVVESDNLPYYVNGRAMVIGDTCFIQLREYPRCLQHEVRHCLEGDWHGNAPNGDDCF